MWVEQFYNLLQAQNECTTKNPKHKSNIINIPSCNKGLTNTTYILCLMMECFSLYNIQRIYYGIQKAENVNLQIQ